MAAINAIMKGNYAVAKARGRHAHRVKTKLLFAATAADETVAAVDAIMHDDLAVLKTRGRRMHRFKTKLLFAATAVDETVVAIDAIVDVTYAVMEAPGQHGVIRGSKRKNKGFKGTNRHEELLSFSYDFR